VNAVMLDVVFVAVIVGFFAACYGFLRSCDRL
jgi:hypothetical protein